jgi:hypothetical protein
MDLQAHARETQPTSRHDAFLRVDRFNHRRLYQYCGDAPPVELEAAYYAGDQPPAEISHHKVSGLTGAVHPDQRLAGFFRHVARFLMSHYASRAVDSTVCRGISQLRWWTRSGDIQSTLRRFSPGPTNRGGSILGAHRQPHDEPGRLRRPTHSDATGRLTNVSTKRKRGQAHH